MHEFETIWRKIDKAGFYWASVSDRAYANPDPGRKELCFEAISAWTNLAAQTEHVRVGCLMLNTLLRNPAHVARAAATIDHVSGGRAELGLGAGYVERDFVDFGFAYPTAKQRLDALEENLIAIRALLDGQSVTCAGKYVNLRDAVCTPLPINKRLRLWVGGQGAKRTPRIVAKYADGAGWAFMSVADAESRNQAVDEVCDEIGRDPREIMRSMNLGCYIGADAKHAARNREQFDRHEIRKEGALLGTPIEALETIAAYEAAGVDLINLTFRQQIDWDGLDCFIEEILPRFQ